jgi:hypothetical protein
VQRTSTRSIGWPWEWRLFALQRRSHALEGRREEHFRARSPRGPTMSGPAGRPAGPVTVERDQHESAFTSILHDLVLRVPGARAAVLVDRDGETVDYWGRLDPYELKLAAAHWRIVLNEVREQKVMSAAAFVVIRAARKSFLVHGLPEAYALVVSLRRGAGFAGWRRAIPACIHALAAEAGWTWVGSKAAAWHPVQVASDAQRKPSAMLTAGRLRPLVILGAVASGVAPNERGWRVRLDTGLEATLVREPGGRWYADDLDEAHHEPASKKRR